MRNNKQDLNRSPLQNQQGMTLIEVIIAILILTIGLLAAATTVAYALQTNYNSRNLTQSKMLLSAMNEQIETLRNTGQLTFGQIANVNQVKNPTTGTQFNGFPTDYQKIYTKAGSDGIFGTNDDDATALDTINKGFERKVVIVPLTGTLKRVDVTVRYPGFRGTLQEITMSSYLNDNSRTNSVK